MQCEATTVRRTEKPWQGAKALLIECSLSKVLLQAGALMSAKAYQDKMALSLVEKLKEVVKNLTIKCVQLAEQGKKLTAKVDRQQKQISYLTDKVMEQSVTIDRLQEKAADLGRLERHLGREQVQVMWND